MPHNLTKHRWAMIEANPRPFTAPAPTTRLDPVMPSSNTALRAAEQERQDAVARLERHATSEGDSLSMLLFTLYRTFGYHTIQRKVNALAPFFNEFGPT